MEQGEYPLRVKANFDRSAVFTSKKKIQNIKRNKSKFNLPLWYLLDLGNCYIWGGEDFTNIGAENYTPVANLKKELNLPDGPVIKDVALGYLHTLALVEWMNMGICWVKRI